MVSVCIATEQDIRSLSKKLQGILENKDSQVYRENVAKFGIPVEYVKEAFSETTLLQAASSEKSTFYLVFDENKEIVGFAQTMQRNKETLELSRIVIFPEHTRKGFGTTVLKRIIEDAKQKKVNVILVNAGKGETHAQRFYEKNGFKPVKEETINPPWGGTITLVTYKLQLK